MNILKKNVYFSLDDTRKLCMMCLSLHNLDFKLFEKMPQSILSLDCKHIKYQIKIQQNQFCI